MGGVRGAFDELASQIVRAGARAVSRRGIVPRRGTLRVPGLSGPVEIHYDEFGVPHIRAACDADLFRGHGVVHALDRYFQMDLLRRVLRGRLAETVGDKPLGAMAMPPFGADRTTADADAFMRALELVPAARGAYRSAGASGRQLLDAYVGGVNAALPLLRRRRPIEYRALGLALKPWSAVDSILVAKGMALGLSFKWRTTLGFGVIQNHLGDRPEHLARMLPQVPGAGAMVMTRFLGDLSQGMRAYEPFDVGGVGSNAYVIGGGRSESGKPILASDPHLELQLPAVWYLASLRGPTYQAVGCSIPGLPGVVIGRTPSMAWGLTNGMIDDADLWIEQLDDAGRRYRVDGAWRKVEKYTVEIKRKGAAPRLLQLRRTHRGPLLSEALPGYDGPPLSIRMTLHENALDLQAFLGLGRARTTAEALRCTAGFGSPAQNLLVADTQGDVGYRMMGLVPMRAAEAHPALPRDGTRSATDWTGFIPEAELPCAHVGHDDVLVAANNPIVDASYPHYLTHLYEPDYRARRIHERLADRPKHDARNMAAIQLDSKNLCAGPFRRLVLEPHAEAVRRMRPSVGPLIDRLLAWEGDERVDARGAAPWHLVYHHLIRRTFEPTLGPTLTRAWMGMMNLVDGPLLRAFAESDSPWAPPGARVALLAEAMEAALADLRKRGLSLDSPWGDMHQLTLRHPAGSVGPLATTFNQGPYSLRGGPFSVSSGQYLHRRPGPAVVGASYRQVIDLASPETGRMITFGGQSGHAGSRHYADLTPLWLQGETLPMRLETPPDTDRRLDLLPG